MESVDRGGALLAPADSAAQPAASNKKTPHFEKCFICAPLFLDGGICYTKCSTDSFRFLEPARY